MTSTRRGALASRVSHLCPVGLVLGLLAWAGLVQAKSSPQDYGPFPGSAQTAEPISPDTIKRYPHLAPYGGHILLGGKDLQVILAGVPSSTQRSLWHPAILAAYGTSGPRPWKRLKALPPVDIHVGGGEESPGALAVDLAVNPQSRTVSATFLFGDGSRSDALRATTYSFIPDAGRLSLLIHRGPNKKSSRLSPGTTESGRPPSNSFKSSLRIHPFSSARIRNFFAESPDGGAISLPAFWLYHADSVVSVVGLKAIREEPQQDGSIVLQADATDKDQDLPFEGFEWLLGRSSTALTVQHQIDLAQCLYGEKRPKSWPHQDPVAFYLETCSDTGNPSLVQLTLPSSDPGGQTTPYPVFVFHDNGRPLAYTALFAGETANLSIPPKVPIRLAENPFGRLLEGNLENPQTLDFGQTEKIDLAARETALIRIDGPDQRRPAVLALKRVDGEASILGAKDNFENGCVVLEKGKYARPVIAIENGVFFAPQWPLYCELAGGEYTMEIMTGRDNTVCRMRAYPNKDHPQALKCPPQTPLDESGLLSRYSYFDLAFPGDMTRRVDSGVAFDPRVKAKEITLHKEGYLWPESASDRAEWLGASYLAEPWGIERFFKSNFKHQDAIAANSLNLPVLRVVDEGSGVVLQYFPATGELIRIFQKFKLRRPDDSVGALLDTISTAESEGFLEIGCPSAHQSIFDYELLVRRAQPNGLRLFGCPSPVPEKTLVTLWARLSLEAEKPYVLTSGSPMDVLPEGGYPRLVAKIDEEKTMDDSLLYALSRSKTLATRGPIMNISVKSVDSGPILELGGASKATQKPKVTPKPFSYLSQVEIERAPEAFFGRVKIELFSDKGPVRTVNYPETLPIPGKLTIPFSSDAGIKWLRAELTIDQALGNYAPSLLAATNWIPVYAGGAISQPATAPQSAPKTKQL